MKNKHVKLFNELNENKNLNISDVISSKTIKIETSKGIIDIPIKDLNKHIDDLKGRDWVKKIEELYDFVSIETDDDNPGWVFVDLSDGYYGRPEYKIINFTNEMNDELEKKLHISDVMVELPEYELDFCNKCFQMTNHLNGICQKCKGN